MTSEVQLDVGFDRIAELGNDILKQVDDVREVAPIFWSERLGAWVVTGHEECKEAFSGRLPLSTARFHKRAVAPIPEGERAARIPYLMRTLPSWVVNVDAPVHTRLRKLMVKAFSRKVAENQRAFSQQAICDAFAAVEGRNSVELVEEVARRIPGRVILRMLGLPDTLLANLREWSIALNSAFGGQPITSAALDRAEAVLIEMRALFISEIEKRRQQPGDDFLSLLVTAHDGDEQLTDEEMLGICYVTLIAGHDTTMNSIVLGTAALAGRPEARAYIRAHPNDMTNIVMELMRFIAMSFSKVRAITQDFEWRGHRISEGQYMYLTIGGANRDPKIFENPEEMDFSRPQGENITFAPGVHHCIGHLVAKVQLEEYFTFLAQHYEPQVLDTYLKFGVVSGFRGLESLHVRLCPRGA